MALVNSKFELLRRITRALYTTSALLADDTAALACQDMPDVQSSRQLVELFAQIQSPEQRKLLLEIARRLAETKSG